MRRSLRLGVVGVAISTLSCSAAQLIGKIGGDSSVKNVVVDDERFGESGSAPSVLKIVVDDKRGTPGDVGRKVKQLFFPDEPRLIFNVAFSCGAPCPCRALYADPKSIWFNVFFGYYQLDVAKEEWKRPFGYYLSPAQPVIALLDILRLGKADWNYFSNYMYGVPEAEIQPYNGIDSSRVIFKQLTREKIGNSYWDHIQIDGVEVVSAYVSGRDGKHLVETDAIWTPVWRALFGPSQPKPEFAHSFIPTHMRAEIFMAYSEHDNDANLNEQRAFSTLMFGATINTDYADWGENEEFLGAQRESIRNVIASDYADAGFPSEDGFPSKAVRRPPAPRERYAPRFGPKR
jgi:hypothetical protein